MHRAMRRRSAGIMRFFLQLAQAAPHLREESIEWLDRLEPEHDNVRAALDHFEQVGRDDLVLELCAGVLVVLVAAGPQ